MASMSNNAIEAYGELRKHGGGAFVVLQMVGGGEIDVVEQHFPSGEEKAMSYDEFVEGTFPSDQARFVIYNLTYTTVSGGERLKVVLFKWVPGDCPRADKMAYSMWGGVVKRTLEGIHCTIQSCGVPDLEYVEVLERASKFEREGVVELQ